MNKVEQSGRTLEVEHRTPYGRDLFYPVNETARAWVKMFKALAFTRDQLRMFKLRGYEIKIVTREVEL